MGQPEESKLVVINVSSLWRASTNYSHQDQTTQGVLFQALSPTSGQQEVLSEKGQSAETDQAVWVGEGVGNGSRTPLTNAWHACYTYVTRI